MFVGLARILGIGLSTISTFRNVLYPQPKFGVLLPHPIRQSKIFRPKIKKLLRNCEGSQGPFFKKLSGLDDQEVCYKKNSVVGKVGKI